MANVLIEETILNGWANTIREKNGITDKMKPSVLLEKTKLLGTGDGVPLTAFTNVLDLDTTILLSGYRMTSSEFSATDNVDVVAILLSEARTYRFRFRGLQDYGGNIFRTSSLSKGDMTHAGGTITASYYDGYVDEYGDFALDITIPKANMYVCFNMYTVPDGAIITIDEPIGTGLYGKE